MPLKTLEDIQRIFVNSGEAPSPSRAAGAKEASRVDEDRRQSVKNFLENALNGIEGAESVDGAVSVDGVYLDYRPRVPSVAGINGIKQAIIELRYNGPKGSDSDGGKRARYKNLFRCLEEFQHKFSDLFIDGFRWPEKLMAFVDHASKNSVAGKKLFNQEEFLYQLNVALLSIEFQIERTLLELSEQSFPIHQGSPAKSLRERPASSGVSRSLASTIPLKRITNLIRGYCEECLKLISSPGPQNNKRREDLEKHFEEVVSVRGKLIARALSTQEEEFEKAYEYNGVFAKLLREDEDRAFDNVGYLEIVDIGPRVGRSSSVSKLPHVPNIELQRVQSASALRGKGESSAPPVIAIGAWQDGVGSKNISVFDRLSQPRNARSAAVVEGSEPATRVKRPGSAAGAGAQLPAAGAGRPEPDAADLSSLFANLSSAAALTGQATSSKQDRAIHPDLSKSPYNQSARGRPASGLPRLESPPHQSAIGGDSARSGYSIPRPASGNIGSSPLLQNISGGKGLIPINLAASLYNVASLNPEVDPSKTALTAEEALKIKEDGLYAIQDVLDSIKEGHTTAVQIRIAEILGFTLPELLGRDLVKRDSIAKGTEKWFKKGKLKYISGKLYIRLFDKVQVLGSPQDSDTDLRRRHSSAPVWANPHPKWSSEETPGSLQGKRDTSPVPFPQLIKDEPKVDDPIKKVVREAVEAAEREAPRRAEEEAAAKKAEAEAKRKEAEKAAPAAAQPGRGGGGNGSGQDGEEESKAVPEEPEAAAREAAAREAATKIQSLFRGRKAKKELAAVRKAAEAKKAEEEAARAATDQPGQGGGENGSGQDGSEVPSAEEEASRNDAAADQPRQDEGSGSGQGGGGNGSGQDDATVPAPEAEAKGKAEEEEASRNDAATGQTEQGRGNGSGQGGEEESKAAPEAAAPEEPEAAAREAAAREAAAREAAKRKAEAEAEAAEAERRKAAEAEAKKAEEEEARGGYRGQISGSFNKTIYYEVHHHHYYSSDSKTAASGNQGSVQPEVGAHSTAGIPSQTTADAASKTTADATPKTEAGASSAIEKETKTSGAESGADGESKSTEDGGGWKIPKVTTSEVELKSVKRPKLKPTEGGKKRGVIYTKEELERIRGASLSDGIPNARTAISGPPAVPDYVRPDGPNEEVSRKVLMALKKFELVGFSLVGLPYGHRAVLDKLFGQKNFPKTFSEMGLSNFARHAIETFQRESPGIWNLVKVGDGGVVSIDKSVSLEPDAVTRLLDRFLFETPGMHPLKPEGRSISAVATRGGRGGRSFS